MLQQQDIKCASTEAVLYLADSLGEIRPHGGHFRSNKSIQKRCHGNCNLSIDGFVGSGQAGIDLCNVGWI